MTGAVNLVFAVVHFALADSADEGFSAATLQGLNALDSDVWVGSNAGFGIMMLGAAGSFSRARRRVPPARLGGSRLGHRIVHSLADVIALLLTALWIVVVSLMLSRGRPDVAARAAPAPA